MKNVLLVSVLLPIFGTAAVALPIRSDAVTRQQITAPLNTATMDDYLLDMARATNVNMLADVSDFAATAPVKAFPATPGAIAGQQGPQKDKWSASLMNVMGDFVAQQKMSTLRSDERTFLFWHEPDPAQLYDLQRQLTIADQKARFAESLAATKAEGLSEAEAITGELSPVQLERVLNDYLRDEQKWTGTIAQCNDKLDLRANYEKLSPALRALLVLDIRQQTLWLNALEQKSFWDESDLRLHAVKTGETTTLNAEYQNLDEAPPKTQQVPLLTLNTEIAPETLPTTPLFDFKEEDAAPQLGERDTFDNVYRGLLDDAYNPTLDADTTLGKAVSVEAKHSTLRAVVTQLEQQSGVHLVVGADVPADKLLTGRMQNMPLSKFMALLSRIYGVKWSKGEGTPYTMNGNDQGDLHLKLLQMGDPARYLFRFKFYNSADVENEKTAVGHAIVQQVGLEALQSTDGVAFSTLPAPLQKRLRRTVQSPIMGNGVAMLYNTNRMLAEQLAKKGLVLRFGIGYKTYDTPFISFHLAGMQPQLRFNAQTEDGTVAVPVFGSFYAPLARPGEQERHSMSLRP